MTRITGTLHGDQNTFLIMSRSVLLRLRNVSDKICKQNHNTHFVFSNIFRYCTVYEIMWKTCRAGQATDDNLIRRMRIACWISKTMNTHSEYVIFIAYPLQQWLQERA